MLYVKNHYKHEWCLKKVQQLRKSGKFKRVKIGNTIKENNQKYSKIYVYNY